MNSKVYKWCAVPLCKNTSIATPKKLFIYVPNKKIVRDKWLKLARRDPSAVVTNSAIYFCEDHFDLPNDMENYMQYHLMGSVSQVRINPGCIPKKFECQLARTQTSFTLEQPYLNKKRKMMVFDKCEKKLEGIRVITRHYDYEEIAPDSSDLGKTRTEYMQEYRKNKRVDNFKKEEIKPTKNVPNSIERSRDFWAQPKLTISETVTDKLTVLSNLDNRHAMFSSLPLFAKNHFCPTDAHNGYNTNIAYQALPHSSLNISIKDENAASIDTKLIASRQSDSSILEADCTNIVKLEPGDSSEYEIKFSEQKKIFSNQNCDDIQNYWYNAFDNMEQPSIDIKERNPVWKRVH